MYSPKPTLVWARYFARFSGATSGITRTSWSHALLALNVSRQAVSKWETGAAEPSTSNLLALAKLYGVDPGDLLRGVQ